MLCTFTSDTSIELSSNEFKESYSLEFDILLSDKFKVLNLSFLISKSSEFKLDFTEELCENLSFYLDIVDLFVPKLFTANKLTFSLANLSFLI